MALLTIMSSPFCKYAGLCVVAAPKVYILVHFWHEFRTKPKHRFCIIRAASVPLLKMLDVSIPPWTAVVLYSSEFALQTRSPQIYMDVYFGTLLRFISARLLASTLSICKRLTANLGRDFLCCGNSILQLNIQVIIYAKIADGKG